MVAKIRNKMIIVGISIFFGDSDYYRFTNLGKKSWLDEKKYIYFLVSALFIRFSTLLHFFIPFLISLLKDFLGDFKVRL